MKRRYRANDLLMSIMGVIILAVCAGCTPLDQETLTTFVGDLARNALAAFLF